MFADTFSGIPTIWKAQTQSSRSSRGQIHHFCPCGVVQLTCLPLMQEITGAKPVRDANFSACGSRGIADPPGLEPGSLGRASRLAPTIFKAPKAFLAMRLLGKQASLVQLQVGDPFPCWPCANTAIEPALRQVS